MTSQKEATVDQPSSLQSIRLKTLDSEKSPSRSETMTRIMPECEAPCLHARHTRGRSARTPSRGYRASIYRNSCVRTSLPRSLPISSSPGFPLESCLSGSEAPVRPPQPAGSS
ncbi:jg24251 [Pararge aegeria aegeria]|uniref:Jg24251 protein n=1 Tax=Pararge aegeria aegeria TaxID=348720 RepID=A0A8S4QTU7_9NEOP|nr:jg24251 [Pararge aegeria aegeria]